MDNLDIGLLNKLKQIRDSEGGGFADFMTYSKLAINTNVDPVDLVSTVTIGNECTNYDRVDLRTAGGTANINTVITLVTDITDPASTGGWTDIYDYSNGPAALLLRKGYHINPGTPIPPSLVRILMSSAETVGDSIRVQILVDSNIVADVTTISNATDNIETKINIPVISGAAYSSAPAQLYHETWFGPIYYQSSFKLRVARDAAFTNSYTGFMIGGRRTDESSDLPTSLLNYSITS